MMANKMVSSIPIKILTPITPKRIPRIHSITLYMKEVIPKKINNNAKNACYQSNPQCFLPIYCHVIIAYKTTANHMAASPASPNRIPVTHSDTLTFFIHLKFLVVTNLSKFQIFHQKTQNNIYNARQQCDM